MESFSYPGPFTLLRPNIWRFLSVMSLFTFPQSSQTHTHTEVCDCDQSVVMMSQMEKKPDPLHRKVPVSRKH